MKKCPSSIRCWDSYPQPSDCESHPVTTFALNRFIVELIKLSQSFNIATFYYFLTFKFGISEEDKLRVESVQVSNGGLPRKSGVS